ncbi:MAG: cyclic nucleotide-binding domain-containing protein [Magnetococcales bacterium]|nr:cyclic nucleotide-binding domain-containing protein [Magnetococcales bacterium]
MAEMKELLGEIDFFEEFTEEEKDQICAGSLMKEFVADTHIIHEGNTDRTLYVLISGKAEVAKASAPSSPLAELTPGAVFGEVALFTHQTRTTDVIAREPVVLFQLPDETYQSLDPDLKVKIQLQTIKILLGRLSHMNRSFLKMVQLQKATQAAMAGANTPDQAREEADL